MAGSGQSETEAQTAGSGWGLQPKPPLFPAVPGAPCRRQLLCKGLRNSPHLPGPCRPSPRPCDCGAPQRPGWGWPAGPPAATAAIAGRAAAASAAAPLLVRWDAARAAGPGWSRPLPGPGPAAPPVGGSARTQPAQGKGTNLTWYRAPVGWSVRCSSRPQLAAQDHYLQT